jgi:hypothetical protein
MEQLMTTARHLRLHLTFAALVLVFTTPGFAQEAPPKGPFKAMHLVNLTDAQAATVQTALADMNAVVAKAGYKDIRYRLYKVFGKQAGTYNYLWESFWPSGEVYQKVHATPEWAAAVKKNAALDALMKNELYNRFVEVAPMK